MRTNQFALPATASNPEPAYPQQAAFPQQATFPQAAFPAQTAFPQQPVFPQQATRPPAQVATVQPIPQSVFTMPAATTAPTPFVPSTLQTPAAGDPTVGSMTAILEREEVPYQPFGMVPPITRGVAAPPEIVYTASAFGIALTPVLVGGLGYAAIIGAREFYSTFAQGGLAFIVILLTVALAVRDRRTLLEAGYREAASPAWLLLSPIAYFIARSVQTKKSVSSGVLPLIVFVLGIAGLVGMGITNPEWVRQILLLS